MINFELVSKETYIKDHYTGGLFDVMSSIVEKEFRGKVCQLPLPKGRGLHGVN